MFGQSEWGKNEYGKMVLWQPATELLGEPIVREMPQLLRIQTKPMLKRINERPILRRIEKRNR